MSTVDEELILLGIAKFRVCCDVIEECRECEGEPKSIPHRHMDGTFFVKPVAEPRKWRATRMVFEDRFGLEIVN